MALIIGEGMRQSFSAALVLAAALSACNRGGALPPGSAESQNKLNAYTEGYNVVIGQFGLKEQFDQYEHAGIGGPRPEPGFVSLNGGWLQEARSRLVAARAMSSGNLRDADAAADRFIPALERVMAHEATLNSYYASKSWREDGLARGRREDPVLVSEFKTAFILAEPLDAALTRARDVGEQARLEEMKGHGDTVGYETHLALNQARKLVQSFSSEADLRDPRTLASADAKAAALSRILIDQHAAVAKAKLSVDAAGPDGWRVDSAGRAGDDLDSLLGSYRDLKAGGGTSSYQAMIASFNSAVSGTNATILPR